MAWLLAAFIAIVTYAPQLTRLCSVLEISNFKLDQSDESKVTRLMQKATPPVSLASN